MPFRRIRRTRFSDWPQHVSAAERRELAAKAVLRLTKHGRRLSPVVVDGRAIATTFWGRAWCENLERYSDFANRLPRGRTYLRTGAVVDLTITPGAVNALVSGSELYQTDVQVAAVRAAQWHKMCADCAGEINSLIELLQGRLSHHVMSRLCQEGTGLFPRPSEIEFRCSCPDRASMCKHVAAVLYGVGARLDTRPELLFTLRKADQQDLIATGGRDLPSVRARPAQSKMLDRDDLAELFGIEIPSTPEVARPMPTERRTTNADARVEHVRKAARSAITRRRG